MCKGERPIGAAKGKHTNTMASCHPPPPLPVVLTGRWRVVRIGTGWGHPAPPPPRLASVSRAAPQVY